METQELVGLVVMGAFFLLLVMLMVFFAFARTPEDKKSPENKPKKNLENEKGSPTKSKSKRAA